MKPLGERGILNGAVDKLLQRSRTVRTTAMRIHDEPKGPTPEQHRALLSAMRHQLAELHEQVGYRASRTIPAVERRKDDREALLAYFKRILHMPTSEAYQAAVRAEKLELTFEALTEWDAPFTALLSDADRAAAQRKLTGWREQVDALRSQRTERVEARAQAMLDRLRASRAAKGKALTLQQEAEALERLRTRAAELEHR